MWAFSGGANLENFYLGAEYAHFNVDREPVFASGVETFEGDTPEFSGWRIALA